MIASDDSVVLNQDDYDFLDHHISTNTKQKYSSAWQQFCTFCTDLNVQPITCSVAVIVKYIRHRFEEGASYSTMNVAKSAISKYHCFLPGNTPVGTDQLVQKAMKSFFKLRPPLPKYRSTFDVSIVMRYVMDMGPVAGLDLKCLTYKTLFLVAFSTLSRYWHGAFCFHFVTTKNYLLQYCIACNVPTLDCLHNRVSSLASLGRLVVLEEGFAQVPLIGLEKVRKKYSNGRVQCLVREN